MFLSRKRQTQGPRNKARGPEKAGTVSTWASSLGPATPGKYQNKYSGNPREVFFLNRGTVKLLVKSIKLIFR